MGGILCRDAAFCQRFCCIHQAVLGTPLVVRYNLSMALYDLLYNLYAVNEKQYVPFLCLAHHA